MSFDGQRRIGNFKPPKTSGMSEEAAEALAATAFEALAEDAARLAYFMRETGIGPDDLRAAAGSRDLLAAVLEHVLGDESLLLVVATQARVKPETIGNALQVLQSTGLRSA